MACTICRFSAARTSAASMIGSLLLSAASTSVAAIASTGFSDTPSASSARYTFSCWLAVSACDSACASLGACAANLSPSAATSSWRNSSARWSRITLLRWVAITLAQSTT
ncbi:hypothetical protein D3C85_1659790 [compost metagenome]